jgi:hypothetical protein
MDAQIELRPNDAAQSRLTFTGRYHPPLGTVSEVVDRAVLHSVAQATAAAFLARISTALQLAGKSESTEPADILGST